MHPVLLLPRRISALRRREPLSLCLALPPTGTKISYNAFSRRRCSRGGLGPAHTTRLNSDPQGRPGPGGGGTAVLAIPRWRGRTLSVTPVPHSAERPLPLGARTGALGCGPTLRGPSGHGLCIGYKIAALQH